MVAPNIWGKAEKNKPKLGMVYDVQKVFSSPEVYSGNVPNFLVWNDQFYGVPWLFTFDRLTRLRLDCFRLRIPSWTPNPNAPTNAELLGATPKASFFFFSEVWYEQQNWIFLMGRITLFGMFDLRVYRWWTWFLDVFGEFRFEDVNMFFFFLFILISFFLFPRLTLRIEWCV